MKIRNSTILLLANVTLLGIGFYLLQSADRLKVAPVESAPVSPKIRQKFNGKNAITASPLVIQTNVVYLTNAFHWSQVESPDYHEYIDRLRTVGCPETTIRDIIITDIMRLYAARRGQFYHNGREFRFWETDEKRKLKATQLEEREQQLAQIDKEIPAVLRELLGINYERELNKYFVDTNEDERRLSFLPEDKRNRLLALRDEIETLREQFGAADDLSEADREELRKIEEYRKAELAKLLTPAELEEFELRTSEIADRLRAELVGFDPTADEFREIFQMRKALEEKYGSLDLSDSQIQQQRAEEEQQMLTKFRGTLGEARYAQYQQSQNPAYRDACVFTTVYELPPSTAQTIFDIQQIAMREKQNLLTRNGISEESRDAALKAIQAETEKSLHQILGTKLLGTYSQSSGKWLHQIGTPN